MTLFRILSVRYILEGVVTEGESILRSSAVSFCYSVDWTGIVYEAVRQRGLYILYKAVFQLSSILGKRLVFYGKSSNLLVRDLLLKRRFI
jgi:hypothetical protein